MTDAKQIVRRLIEDPWKGDTSVIDELVGPDYIGHDPSAREPISGPEGVKTQLQQYLDGFSDGRITVDDQIAEGDKVASRWTARGTQTGEVAGIAPTGKEVTVSGLTISLLEDGLVVEEWIAWDTLGMLVQLGAIPAPAEA